MPLHCPSESAPDGGGRHVVGLVADPGLPLRLAEDMAQTLPEVLSARLGDTTDWEVRVVERALPVSADGGMILPEAIHELADQQGWDTVVAVVDLPRFEDGRGVVADVVPAERWAVVCVPALGVLRTRHRLRETLARVVGHVLGEEHVGAAEDLEFDADSGRARTDLSAGLTPLPHTETRAETEGLLPDGTRSGTVFARGLRGRLRLLSGMVAANRPLQMPRSMSWTLASAGAVGAYGIFFGSIWVLSNEMSIARLTAVMLVSLALLVVWLITANGMWAPSAGNRGRAGLDNAATLVTVGAAVCVLYAGLFLGLALVAGLIIPQGYLAAELDGSAGVGDYVALAWLATSMGMIAGAVGSSFDDSEAIRTATYSRRERRRREAAEERARAD
ncbi:hypothetical protein HMPREF2863_08100 [Micrococcus sp. HMSC067E09]|nr:hypothetical protein HMPREF2863_08100 [Micrococcus sp. HMSC067E09]